MTDLPAEATQVHTHMLRCTLEVDESRAYWRHVTPGTPAVPLQVFEHFWFGARSLARVEFLLWNLRARFDSYPAALAVLHRWPHMAPDTRRLLCHFHTQLADPLYRAFSGDFLVQRRAARPQVTRDQVVTWVGQQGGERWTLATRIKFASKLLSAAHAAGLVATTRDPRPLCCPRVSDEALAYLLYLLRGLCFAGTLLDNPYLASVGLVDGALDDRLRALPGLRYQRQGDLIDLGFTYPDLGAWADATLGTPGSDVPTPAGGSS